MENVPCAEPYRGKVWLPMFCQSDGQGVTRVQEGCKDLLLDFVCKGR